MKPIVSVFFLSALTISIQAWTEPVPTSARSISLYEVDEVYTDIPRWDGTKVLNISDFRMSSRLSATLVRRFVVAGADYRVENRVGTEIDSWVTTGRLKRMLKKHEPSIVIVTFDADHKNQSDKDTYMAWVKEIIEQIGSTTCYWIGPQSLAQSETGFSETLKEYTRPCHYIDPHAIGNIEETKPKHIHTDKRAWAELMWKKMNATTPGKNK